MILYIDIETVPLFSSVTDLPKTIQKHWQRKLQFVKLKEDEIDDEQKAYRGHAGVYAEWSKVVCIGLGYINPKTNEFKQQAINIDNEKDLLLEFKRLIYAFKAKTSIVFCGHNIKEFDLPFLCRRMVIHGIPLPDELNLAGLKPWENNHIDTMELWRFGDYKRYTALDLLAQILGLESPKQDIDGSQVADVYYNDGDIERITTYCLQDVKTTAQVYHRLKNIPIEFI